MPLAHRITAAVDADKLGAWKSRLVGVKSERVVDGIVDTARRIGLIAAADLRFVARLLTRLDESLPKMQTVGKIEDLDEFIGGALPVRALISFAASDAFGRALAG